MAAMERVQPPATTPGHVAASATVEPGAHIGPGTAVWDQTQVRAGARVGGDCVIGRGVFVDHDVVIGDFCKVQNNALLYAPAVLGTGVFVGPAAVLANDRLPRAVTPDGRPKGEGDWTMEGVVVEDGASVGAAAVVGAGVRVGAWSLVAAGAVVTADVPPFALVAGVPARFVHWIGRSGRALERQGDGSWRCPDSGYRYREDDGTLTELP